MKIIIHNKSLKQWAAENTENSIKTMHVICADMINTNKIPHRIHFISSIFWNNEILLTSSHKLILLFYFNCNAKAAFQKMKIIIHNKSLSLKVRNIKLICCIELVLLYGSDFFVLFQSLGIWWSSYEFQNLAIFCQYPQRINQVFNN